MMMDPHYVDIYTKGSHYYRQSLPRRQECVNLMQQQQVDFLKELGDLIDQDDEPNEELAISYLRAVESIVQNGESRNSCLLSLPEDTFYTY